MEPEANAEMTKIAPHGLQVAVPLVTAGNLRNFETHELKILKNLCLIFFFNIQVALRTFNLKIILNRDDSQSTLINFCTFLQWYY